MMKFVSSSPSDTEQLGYRLGCIIADAGEPAVIAMRGGLGAGKTAFARGFAGGLGVNGPVTSPTFTIVNEYNGRMPFFHFDLYRILSDDELLEIGYDDYLDRNGVLLIEWSENVGSEVLSADSTVSITYGSQPDDRVIEVEGKAEGLL